MPQATSTKNLANIGRVVFELCERTDRQTDNDTDILITILRTPPRGELIGPNR